MTPIQRLSSWAQHCRSIEVVNSRHFAHNLLFALLLVLSALGIPLQDHPVSAATLTVTSELNSGAGTLRAAVASASPGDTITFSSTVMSRGILLTSPITVDKDLTIQAPVGSQQMISGGMSTQIFIVTAGTLRLSRLLLGGGRINGSNGAPGQAGTISALGGAIFVGSGAGLTATDVVFNANEARGGNGGSGEPGIGHGGGGGNGGSAGQPGSFGGGGGGGEARAVPGPNGGFGGGGGGTSGSGLSGGAGGGGYGGDGADALSSGFGYNGGGGGAGLGGAVFIAEGGAAGFRNTSFTNNKAQGGNGGSGDPTVGGGAGGGGAGLGSAIFNNGHLCIRPTDNVTFTNNRTGGGAAGTSGITSSGPTGEATNGAATDTRTGIFDLSGGGDCSVWYYAPTNITLAAASLYEDQPVGTLAGTLATTDQDAGDIHTYNLVSGTGDTDNTSFAIHGNRIETASMLDFETKPTYSIRVRTTDSHGKWYEKALTVTIIRNPLTYSVSGVNENTAGYPSVAEVIYPFPPSPFPVLAWASTTDCPGTDNAGFTFEYRYDSPSTPPGHIDIRALAPLDYETQSSYSICLRVTKTADFVFDFPLTIPVFNVNEPPTDIALSASSLNENTAANSLVGLFSSTDEDTGETFTYQLASGEGSTDNTALTIPSGSNRLQINASPNFEAKSTYSIRVRSTDSGGASFEKIFMITINDLPEAPTDITLSPGSLAENSPANSSVGTLTAADEDTGETFTFSLVSGASADNNAAFAISGNQLLINNSPDYETQNSYSARVRCTDGDGLSTEKAFTIAVTNVNEAPEIAALADVDAVTGKPLDFVLPASAVTDPDGDTLTVSATTSMGDPLPGWLSFDPAILAFSGTPYKIETFRVQVTASDGDLSASDTFDINVTAAPGNHNPVPVKRLPNTGFAPNRTTQLPLQPVEQTYADLGDVWLEIPPLRVKASITGVPLVGGEWDAAWLGNAVGWLEGTAFPGWAGNAALSGHVVNANGKPGVFANLGALKWGDLVIVHAFGQAYTYEVRAVDRWIRPDDVSVITHEERPWLSLITCRSYNPATDRYDWRTLVRAVLVSVETE